MDGTRYELELTKAEVISLNIAFWILKDKWGENDHDAKNLLSIIDQIRAIERQWKNEEGR